MSLQGHEKAARIIAQAMLDVSKHAATKGLDPTACLVVGLVSDGFRVAADRMDEAIRAEASGRPKS